MAAAVSPGGFGDFTLTNPRMNAMVCSRSSSMILSSSSRTGLSSCEALIGSIAALAIDQMFHRFTAPVAFQIGDHDVSGRFGLRLRRDMRRQQNFWVAPNG